MYVEYFLSYERNNIIEENLINLGEFLSTFIDQSFIENEIFFGHDGDYSMEDYGSGKVIVLKSNHNDEFLLLNTFLVPGDQFQVMGLGVRCKSEKKKTVLNMICECFENEELYPINERIKEFSNEELLNISKMNIITLDMFFNNSGPKYQIKVYC